MYGRWIDEGGNTVVFEAGESASFHDFDFVGEVWPYDWRGELVGGEYEIIYKDGKERQHMTCRSHNGEYVETVIFEIGFAEQQMILKQTIGGTRLFRFSKSI